MLLAQAQSEVAQLHSQLEVAFSQQEALQQALHEMQATIAVLRDQIQHQADATAHASVPHNSDRSDHRAHSEGRAAGLSSNTTSALVQALQQQVAELKSISSFLDDSQHQTQQQQQQPPVLRAASAAGQGLRQKSSPRVGSVQYGSAAQAVPRHECMMPPPPPRSLPSRRLPMSAYASPASHSHLHQTDSIKAHHPVRQSAAVAGAVSTSDKCWCGRPKKMSGTALCTPVRHIRSNAGDLASSWGGQQEGFVRSYSSTPVRDSDR